MTKQLSELFSRLDSVNQAILHDYGKTLIVAIEEHQKTSFYERHLPLAKDQQEQQLLAFYSDIVNQGLDSKEVLKTSKKIKLVEKTLTDKTPILIPLELHVFISELNLSIAQQISTTSQTGSADEIRAFMRLPEDYNARREIILQRLNELSQYILQLLQDQSKVKRLKKSRLLFKSLGLSYFYGFITHFLSLVESLPNVSQLNTMIIKNEYHYLTSANGT